MRLHSFSVSTRHWNVSKKIVVAFVFVSGLFLSGCGNSSSHSQAYINGWNCASTGCSLYVEAITPSTMSSINTVCSTGATYAHQANADGGSESQWAAGCIGWYENTQHGGTGAILTK